MEIIYKIWDCLGKNSGQIQIIIALVAFWYAFKGYKKVLEQIQMAKEQSSESEKQTGYFADQVKEAAKQTEFAAKQFEASNLQVQQLIDHRDLVLNIRTEELRSDCIDMCVKALLAVQETELVLKNGIKTCKGRIAFLELNQEALDWLNQAIQKMESEALDFKKRCNDLITISGGLATVDNIPKDLNEIFLTVKMIYLRSIRSKFIYEEFMREVERTLPIARV